jgi:hypothetical protein
MASYSIAFCMFTRGYLEIPGNFRTGKMGPGNFIGSQRPHCDGNHPQMGQKCLRLATCSHLRPNCCQLYAIILNRHFKCICMTRAQILGCPVYILHCTERFLIVHPFITKCQCSWLDFTIFTIYRSFPQELFMRAADHALATMDTFLGRKLLQAETIPWTWYMISSFS